MPYHVGTSAECPASKPHAVIKDDDGQVMGCHATKEVAQKQIAALYANEEANTMSKKTRDDFEHRYGSFGGREIRTFPFEVEDVRDAEGGRSPDFVVRGHASVTGKWSLDLGGFREQVHPKAFDQVLAGDPHVVHDWDHDTRYVFSSTRNKTLELRMDPVGLHFWSRVAPTSYAADLRVLLDRGDITQSSFAFTVAKDEWKVRKEGEDEVVERTILEVGELFDVTTTALGAYPQTDSQVVKERALDYARTTQRLPDSPPAETPADTAPDEVADDGTGAPPKDGAVSEANTAAQAKPAAREGAALFALKTAAKTRIAEAKALQEQLEKDLKWR